VEKGLTSFDGVYPTMAQEFAKAFGSGAKFINREEDCGEIGLRTSKTQYRPIEIKNKNAVVVKTLFDKIEDLVNLKTDRLTLSEITKQDKEVYAKLYLDSELNKFWGYDYKEDCLGKPTPEYFIDFVQKLKDKKEEYDFAVKKDGKLVGELCLYNFDFYGTAELGFRFIPKEQGKGYAIESAKALIDYAFNELKIVNLKARAFKQNIPSHKLLNKLGFAKLSEDEKFIYYKLER
jgi:RimJ/RimL family protein N-acetyltransferase